MCADVAEHGTGDEGKSKRSLVPEWDQQPLEVWVARATLGEREPEDGKRTGSGAQMISEIRTGRCSSRDRLQASAIFRASTASPAVQALGSPCMVLPRKWLISLS